MSYLVCDKCGGHYELQEGESPEDFDPSCDCGGKLENKKSLSSSYESAPKQENECFKLDKKSIIWIIGSFVALSLFLFMHFIINIPTIIAAVIPGLIVGLVMRLYFKHFL